jgi:anaerobic selenocysteine-containing dehydrogenase
MLWRYAKLRAGEKKMQSEIRKTYCRICMVNCGLALEVAGDQIVRVKGDFDHPLTKGYTCPKGRATGALYHQPDPYTHPLMRKNGALVRVSWDEALDDIAAKLRHIIDAHGPRSVGMYWGSGLGIDSAGYAMEEAFWAALDHGPKFTPLTNDGTAKTMISGAMAATYAINPKTDYDNVEMLIYVGTNPMVSHAHNTGMFNPPYWIKEAAKRGEVWTIDPVATETAKFSTRHIAAYPVKTMRSSAGWCARLSMAGRWIRNSKFRGWISCALHWTAMTAPRQRRLRVCAKRTCKTCSTRSAAEAARRWKPEPALRCRRAATSRCGLRGSS